MKQTILVVGATGMLGEPVARQLQKDGYIVRVLAQNPTEARKKLGESFDIIKGDVEDISSLEKALSRKAAQLKKTILLLRKDKIIF